MARFRGAAKACGSLIGFETEEGSNELWLGTKAYN